MSVLGRASAAWIVMLGCIALYYWHLDLSDGWGGASWLAPAAWCSGWLTAKSRAFKAMAS